MDKVFFLDGADLFDKNVIVAAVLQTVPSFIDYKFLFLNFFVKRSFA